MKRFGKNLIFNSKTAAAITAVCVLLSVFVSALKSEALYVYPPLDIAKAVDKTSPLPGEEITYTLNYKNNTSNEFTGVIIKDPFTNQNQNYLIFISANPSPAPGTHTWNIGSLGPNKSGQITIKAKVSSSIPGWSSEIKNKATIDSDQTSLRYSNNASVFIIVNDYSSKNNDIYTGGTTTSSKLNINKLVRNITKGSSYNYSTNWLNTIYAEPGDELEFLIKIKTPKDKEIDSIRVSDDLPPKLTYISDSTAVDGYYEPDGITTKNIYIGEAYPYLERKISFKAKVASVSNFKSYPITIVNTAYAWGSDGNKVKDTVKIIIKEPNSIPATESTTISTTNSVKSWDDGLIKGNSTYSNAADASDEETAIATEPGEVLGAEDVQVGINLFSVIILSIISCIIAFVFYCRLREEKLLEALNKDGNHFRKTLAKLYFRLKFFWTVSITQLR